MNELKRTSVATGKILKNNSELFDVLYLRIGILFFI